MQILKFGGASVRDADGVRNLEKVLQSVGTEKTLIVISAMGKTTNALEKVIEHYFNSKHELQSSIQDVKKYHNGILLELFENESHEVFKVVTALFRELSEFFDRNKSPDYSFVYDQTIGFGELISTTIVSYYLNHKGVKNKWLDVRELIKTNSYYRNAKVEWALTQSKISEAIDEKALHITQGFLGSDGNNFTTTLGREGSDYTAAIFAFCLNAKSVTIWKDVPGVLNADPRFFENPTLLDSLSYEEAIELSYYGASVIHPKTLQPLQQKEIPLYVKCFLEPKNKGTKVGKSLDLSPNVPCYILRKDQILITVSSLDFSYIVEENISHIFKLLHLYKMKVRSIQNSAISFSVCIENSYNHLEPLILQLKAKYNVRLDKAVDLYTIRHYTTDAIEEIQKNKTVLMKQITPKTVQIITK
ncbi:aspartate kinase [Formosa sp. Hel3_A1_48]|jgi:aspartate kinase|uniref:aspartate kinase n=1 Tax=Formosa sp. Hel3_A1_48 TaxID=1336795 RepID=UPI00084E1E0B|nr:aspartate kinase [Formosa sp. Hel3_A1_48]AOR26000.1 aspartate kinase [Formosa sp. Hel3_A1_48]MDC0950711.1 aspartate kinase [Flavobacteriaceae bacterium]MDG1672517.1 aspartate kinase [Flavobacteriaceae bacterium]